MAGESIVIPVLKLFSVRFGGLPPAGRSTRAVNPRVSIHAAVYDDAISWRWCSIRRANAYASMAPTVAGLQRNELKAGHGELTEPRQRVIAVAHIDVRHLADPEDIVSQTNP